MRTAPNRQLADPDYRLFCFALAAIVVVVLAIGLAWPNGLHGGTIPTDNAPTELTQ